MEKIKLPHFRALFTSFIDAIKQAKSRPLFLIFSPVSFAFAFVLAILFFVHGILEALFSYLPDTKEEHIAYRVTSLIVLSFVHFLKILALGAFNVCIFIFGFFYDAINKLMTLNKSTSIIVEF